MVEMLPPEGSRKYNKITKILFLKNFTPMPLIIKQKNVSSIGKWKILWG